MPSSTSKTGLAKPSGHSADLFNSPQKRSVILCLLLVVTVLGVYNPVIRHPFVNFDDDRYIVNNPQVQAGLSWHTVVWAFTTTSQANWHPLTWLSHALDCQLYHLNPAGHHYTNVLLHAVNVVLLFLLLQWTTGFTWRSFMVAALFALHPINVESVAWISERKNLLSMLFFLLALWAYGWYARKPGVWRYCAVAGLFAYGLMAKPQIITFPFVLLLWDYWPLGRMFSQEKQGRPFWWLVREKIPLLALSAASAIITMKAQRAGGAVRAITEFSLSVRLQNALVAYVRYVGKALWPTRLAPLYPHPGNSLPALQVAAACGFLLAVSALVWAGRRRRYLLVGWCWFLGTLVPMIGLVQVGEAAMADRYAYGSFIGLFLMACWGLPDWSERRNVSARWWVLPAGAALFALALLTGKQLSYWQDNVTLWTHTLQVTTNNYIAEDNLGGALIEKGQFDHAMPYFEAAVKINPRDPVGNLDIATHEQQAGDVPQAIDLYLKVLGMTNDAALRANTFTNLGAAYRSSGDLNRAEASYRTALNLDPDNDRAAAALGLLRLKTGDPAGASQLFAHAMAVRPTDVGYLLLAQALQESGQLQQAQAARDAAQRISHDISAAQQQADEMLSR